MQRVALPVLLYRQVKNCKIIEPKKVGKGSILMVALNFVLQEFDGSSPCSYWKTELTQKLNKNWKASEQLEVGQDSILMMPLSFSPPDVCLILAFSASETELTGAWWPWHGKSNTYVSLPLCKQYKTLDPQKKLCIQDAEIHKIIFMKIICSKHIIKYSLSNIWKYCYHRIINQHYIAIEHNRKVEE